jgi:hypothetical protein
MRASVIATIFLVAVLGVSLQLRSDRPLIGMPAEAQEPAHPAPPERPRETTRGPAVRPQTAGEPMWKAEVSGEFQTTAAAARLDAQKAAARKLGEKLRDKIPGFRYEPTVKFLTDNRMLNEGVEEKQVLTDPSAPVMLRQTVTVELREPQLKVLMEEDRRERVTERLWQAGHILAGLLAMLVAVAGYVRLDDWTKGYFSLPLKLGALALAAGGAVVLVRAI